jgi:DNA-binding NtrC family response regulator
VRVTSVPGKGSSFEVVLPVETGMTLPKPPPPKPVARPPSPARARVLVIDDEPMLLEALFRMLRRSHEVILAEGGTAALSRLEEDPTFDVVICDLMMPDIDGIKLYGLVGKRWPVLQERMVFCSGGAFAPEAKEFIASVSKSNVVVEKPIKQDTLLQAVNRVIERHGPQEATARASNA